jgi:hypothetical protein
MSNYDYKVHPLAELFPALSAEEFEKLKRDIEVHGQLEPIIVAGTGSGTRILDGRHRLKACEELGLEPRLLHFSQILQTSSELRGKLTEAEFIWARNVLRRHLSEGQRAAIAVIWSEEIGIRAAAKEAQKRKPASVLAESPKQPVHTRERLAEKAQVSTHKIRQAEEVAKTAPEMLFKVASGEVKLRDAVQQTERRQAAPPTFDEQAVLLRLYKDWEVSVEKHWPKNRDLSAVIRKVLAFATYLEGIQKVRAAELQKKVQAVGVQVRAR